MVGIGSRQKSRLELVLVKCAIILRYCFTEGVLSYSMPQGDERGNDFYFYDWTYDGDRIENRLINGLGCLTDGDYGPDNFKLSYYAKGKNQNTFVIQLLPVS